jgi:hypothetical protein
MLSRLDPGLLPFISELHDRGQYERRTGCNNYPKHMLAIIGIILLLCWILGLTLHIAGGLIHIALVLAVIMVAMHFLRGNRPA